MMFEVSAYAVHSIVSKFLAIWRWAQMTSEWITFFISMLCCQCFDYWPNSTNSSSISGYMIMPNHSVYLDAGDSASHHMDPNSDTEVQISNEVVEISHEELDFTDSIATTGPSIYIEQACGEPIGQQLVVDFTPHAGDTEIDIRNPVYGPDSSSLEVSSESEPGYGQARGDHRTRAEYRASRCANGSEEEVLIKTHYPEYDSSSSEFHTTPGIHNELVGNRQEPREELIKTEITSKLSGFVKIDLNLANDFEPSLDSNQIVSTVDDQILEFESCFSTPMALFRRTDPQWKAWKADIAQGNDSEIELKNHIYTAVNGSDDNDLVPKEVEQKNTVFAASPESRGLNTADQENFPSIHKARNKEFD